METNSKSFIVEIQIPHNESLEQILATIPGYDVDFYEKRKSGITKIEFTKKEKPYNPMTSTTLPTGVNSTWTGGSSN